jgi:GT2 family glycosyltransferase
VVVPGVSIVIATWERREHLRRLVLSLQDQTIDRDAYEIIVCDSDSTDGTAESITELREESRNIRFINVPTNTPTAKRNEGIRQAFGPIVILLDDDLAVNREFVAAHLDAHSTSTLRVFCGQVRYPPDWIAKSNYFRFKDSRHLGKTRLDIDHEDIPFQLIVAMNLSFKREEVLQLVGWFAEDFKHYGCEDLEFGYRISKAGIKIGYIEDALAYHYEDRGSSKRYMRKIYFAARYGVPILQRIAPEATDRTAARFFEPAQGSDSSRTKLAKMILPLFLHPVLAEPIRLLVEKSDRLTWLYFPFLFRYLTAVAHARGAHARLAEHSGTPEGWFE